MSPERYHEKNHAGRTGDEPFEGCWRCGRARAICKSKISYASYEDAQLAADEINIKEGYKSPLTRYVCRWCLLWHLTTAKTKIRVKRTEKQRRKWLRREMEKET